MPRLGEGPATRSVRPGTNICGAQPYSSSTRLREIGVTSGRLVEAGLEPDLNLVLSDIDAKLQLFETVQNRAQDLYDYLEDTK